MKSFDQQVADWARTKPADEAYDYELPLGCALCQFLSANGYSDAPRVVPNFWRDGVGEEWIRFDDRLEDALAKMPHTFGALADRLSERGE